VIDWPNLLIGALLGAVITAIPWAIDHSLVRRDRFADALAAWAVAAKRIELLAILKTTTLADLYRTRLAYPIDRWRLILGPNDFVLLEGMEAAYHRREAAAQAVADDPGNAALKRQQRTVENKWKSASVAFINMSRGLQDGQQLATLYRESRRRFWRSLGRHPVATLRGELHERRARRAAERQRPR